MKFKTLGTVWFSRVRARFLFVCVDSGVCVAMCMFVCVCIITVNTGHRMQANQL